MSFDTARELLAKRVRRFVIAPADDARAGVILLQRELANKSLRTIDTWGVGTNATDGFLVSMFDDIRLLVENEMGQRDAKKVKFIVSIYARGSTTTCLYAGSFTEERELEEDSDTSKLDALDRAYGHLDKANHRVLTAGKQTDEAYSNIIETLGKRLEASEARVDRLEDKLWKIKEAGETLLDRTADREAMLVEKKADQVIKLELYRELRALVPIALGGLFSGNKAMEEFSVKDQIKQFFNEFRDDDHFAEVAAKLTDTQRVIAGTLVERLRDEVKKEREKKEEAEESLEREKPPHKGSVSVASTAEQKG